MCICVTVLVPNKRINKQFFAQDKRQGFDRFLYWVDALILCQTKEIMIATIKVQKEGFRMA